MKTHILAAALALIALITFVGLPLCATAPPDESKEPRPEDVKLLQDAGVEMDGPGLVAFFRLKTESEEQRRDIAELIKQLGDDRFEVREQATRKLIALGRTAVPALRQALDRRDAEIVRRVKLCLTELKDVSPGEVPAAAVRVLTARKSPQAVAALLAFLPDAADRDVEDEVDRALTALGMPDGQPNSALVAALTDKVPLRRAAAGTALAKVGGAEQRPAVRKLLRDADPVVRVRVAWALAGVKDKEAVPVLIDALADAPPAQRQEASEALFLLADDKSPDVALGDDDASRKKCRDEWATWWQANSAKVDLARLHSTHRSLGYTLLVETVFHDGPGKDPELGRVLEIDRAGKIRWQIGGLQFPTDARMIGDDRVLICEYHEKRRVTERDLKGNILWEKAIEGNPVNAQRLPNGNTFIATNTLMLEVDRTGKEVFSSHLRAGPFLAGCKLPNGEIIYQDRLGPCVRVTAQGKEIKTFNAPYGSWPGAMDLSPGGRILLTECPSHWQDYRAQDFVNAYDPDGKLLFQVKMSHVTTASWLPNGNLLAASYADAKVVELDRTGRVIWEGGSGNNVFRARRR